ncbi:TPA: FkbM family methyltransferase, partial [Campylobacter jejuni]
SIIKIDVEGMETKVLNGAINTIKKYRPLLYIEAINSIEFKRINVILEKLDYVYWNTFNATPTHLYYPKERLEYKDILSNVSYHNALESYRITQSLNYSKKLSVEISKIIEITSKNNIELYTRINDLEVQKAKLNKEKCQFEQDLKVCKEKLKQKDSELKRIENTLSYRIGNRIVKSKNIKDILILPYNLFKEYRNF